MQMSKTERIERLEKEVEVLTQAIDVLLDRVARIELRQVSFPSVPGTPWLKFNPNVTPIGDWPFGPAITC